MLSDDFTLDESIHGLRFNWNVFPSTRLEESHQVTPIGCLYSLLHKRPLELKAIPVSDTGRVPPKCSFCKNYINPYVKVDRANGMWVCCFCEKKTYFPSDYPLPTTESPEAHEWPIELQQVSSTIDHVLPVDIANPVETNIPFVYMFIIDMYITEGHEKEFENYLQTVANAISNVPDGSLIGVIGYNDSVTFSNGIQISPTINLLDDIDMELDQTKKKSKKNKSTSIFSEAIMDAFLSKIGITAALKNSWEDLPLVLSKIVTQDKNEAVRLLKSLKSKISNSYKPSRVTGLALYLASLLISQCSFSNFIGKIVLITSGPCTAGPGMVADTKNPMRSHSDIFNLNAPFYSSAEKFYRTLAYLANGHAPQRAQNIVNSISGKLTDQYPAPRQPRWAVDLFVGSLDQVGVYEMKSLSALTCGGIYLNDNFERATFNEGMTSALFGANKTNAVLSVATSRGLKVSKMLGNGCPLPPVIDGSDLLTKISDQVSEFDPLTKKLNFTNRWQFNMLKQEDDCVGVYFYMDTVSSASALTVAGITHAFIQFQLTYRDRATNSLRVRVTTIKKPTTLASMISNQVKLSNGTYKLVNSKSKIIKERDLLLSFDQEAWVVLFARLLTNKIDTTIGYDRFEDLLGLIDNTVIRLLYHFGGVSLTQDRSDGATDNPYLMLKLIYEVNENFNKIPALIFHLRRSQQLVRIFNSSPDETASYHHWFNKLNLSDSLLLIQPTLYRLTPDDHTTISLDSTCLQSPSSTFLIMDCLFQIIVYYVASESSKLSLHHSNNEALVTSRDPSIIRALEFIEQKIMTPDSRRPPAQIIITQTNHSQARYFISRLDKVESLEENMKKMTITDNDSKKKRLGMLGWFTREKVDASTTKTYDILKTDDLGVHEYYQEILDLVGKYKVTDF